MSDEVYDMIFKLVIIGDSYVGKTNIMSQYLKKEFNVDSKATVGVEFGSKEFVVNNKTIKAQIWDTAGQERYKAITNAYYKGSLGAFVVFDITKKVTFDNVDRWVQEVRTISSENIKLLLIGNKCDLESQRQVSKEQGEMKARNLNMAFLETSALNGQNLDKAFDIMIHEVYNKFHVDLEKDGGDTVKDAKGVDLSKKKIIKKNICCKNA